MITRLFFQKSLLAAYALVAATILFYLPLALAEEDANSAALSTQVLIGNPLENLSDDDGKSLAEPVYLNYVWVPKGSLQVHLDFLHTRADNDASRWVFPQAWLRYGVTDKLQVVVKPPSYARVDLGRGLPLFQGVEGLYTGVQYNLDDKPGGIDVAVEGGVWSPTASEGLDFPNVTPEAKLYIQGELPFKSWAYFELPARLVETNPRSKFFFEPFAIAGHVVRPNVSVFVSYKGFWVENFTNSHEVGGGLSINLRPTTQVNLYTGSGIGPGSPKLFAGLFFSQRFDG